MLFEPTRSPYQRLVSISTIFFKYFIYENYVIYNNILWKFNIIINYLFF